MTIGVSPRLRRPLAAGVTAGVISMGGLLTAPAALAHDVVISSTPEAGAVVSEFPEEIVLEFSGQPREGFNTLAVTNADSGESLFSTEPTVDGRTLTAQVPSDVDAEDGTYTIGFQITSSDGHSTRDGIEFTVGSGASTSDTADQAAADSSETVNDANNDSETDEQGSVLDEETSGVATWIIAGGAVAAAIAVIAMLIAKRKKFDSQ